MNRLGAGGWTIDVIISVTVLLGFPKEYYRRLENGLFR